MAKYKIAVVGCGGISQPWLEHLTSKTEVEIVALVDILPENAKEKNDKYELNSTIYTSLEEALTHTDTNMVVDLTIPESHYKIVSTAIKAGCYVLGEKPMANSIEEVNAIVRLVDDHNAYYAIMQNRRFLPGFRGLQELLSKDILGDISYMGTEFFLGPHFGGFRDIMESPLLLDMAIHTFDQARFLLNNPKPISVYCHEYNPKFSWYKGDASAICIFEFDNGCVFNYTGSWCSTGIETTWEGKWRIQGTNGTAIYKNEKEVYAELSIEDSEEVNRILPTFEWQKNKNHAGCIDEMFEAIEEGRRAETDCRDNRYSMAMVFGALKSSREGRKVYIEEELLK